jgi:hypothetical protein
MYQIIIKKYIVALILVLLNKVHPVFKPIMKMTNYKTQIIILKNYISVMIDFLLRKISLINCIFKKGTIIMSISKLILK